MENVLIPEMCSNSVLEQAVILADKMEPCASQRLRFVRSVVAGKTVSPGFCSMKNKEGYHGEYSFHSYSVITRCVNSEFDPESQK